jgi:hypothetical protein
MRPIPEEEFIAVDTATQIEDGLPG